MRLYSALVVCFALFMSTRASVYDQRQRSLFTMFDDPDNVPVDPYIDDGTVRPTIPDSNDSFDPDGADIDITTFAADIFGTTITNLRCFDVGFCDCDPAAAPTSTMPANLPTDTANGLDLTAGACRIAPFVGVADNANKYHMAYRFVDKTLTRNLHDIDRINAEVNTALEQYKTKFSAKLGLILSWRMTSAATELNEFQAILAVGDTDTGATETYIIFLYGTMAWAGTGVQGFVTGTAGGAAAGARQFARVCSQVGSAAVTAMAPAAELVANSNSKCGDPGIYVFGVEAAAKACVDETTACDTESKLACNQTSVPLETCTETFYCMRPSSNPTVVRLMLHLKWYKWGRIQAIDSNLFSTTGEQSLVTSALGTCGKDLANPDTETSVDFYSLDIPLAIPGGPCGVELDTTAGTVKFAFKIYDGLANSAMIDKWGDTILTGTCYYEDLPHEANVTVMFNGPSTPTIMPPRSRVLTLTVVDRPSPDSAEIITVLPLGRGYFLLVTYDHGSPFNPWADPFGVYIESCWASNNAAFVDDPATWERSEQFITTSCPVDKTTLTAVWTPKAFEADPTHALNPPVAGNVWYQVAGPILAARWNKLNTGVLVDKIFFKCTAVFCTLPDEFASCEDACTTDRRKRRSIDDEEMEVLYTSVIIEDPTSDSEEEPVTGIPETPCTSFNIALATLVALLALLLIFATLCILLFVKLTTAKRQWKRGSSMKKTGLK